MFYIYVLTPFKIEQKDTDQTYSQICSKTQKWKGRERGKADTHEETYALTHTHSKRMKHKYVFISKERKTLKQYIV